MHPRPGPGPFDIALGQAMRAARLARGMSQQDLSRTLGITYQQIHKYETDYNRIAAARLVDIARALRTDPATMLQAAGVETLAPEPQKRQHLELARAAATLPSEMVGAITHLARTIAQQHQAAA